MCIRDRSLAYEAAAAEQIRPWYVASVAQDRMNREHAATESPADDTANQTEPEPETEPGAVDPKTFVRDLMREGLMPAVRTDATVFRAFVRAFNLLEAPDALMADADVIARVMAAYADRDQRPPEPPLGPPRAELMAVLEPA